MLADPTAFVKASYRVDLRGTTHLSITSLETYIHSLGHSDDDIDAAFDEVLGFTLSDPAQIDESKDPGASSVPQDAPGQPGSNEDPMEELRLPVKAIPGRYKYTKFGSLTPEEVANMKPFYIACDKPDWDDRTVTQGEEKSSAKVHFDFGDELWHLSWQSASSGQHDLAFWLERSENNTSVSKFGGVLKPGGGTEQETGTAIEGVWIEDDLQSGSGTGGLFRGLQGSGSNDSKGAIDGNDPGAPKQPNDPKKPDEQVPDQTPWIMGGFAFLIIILILFCFRRRFRVGLARAAGVGDTTSNLDLHRGNGSTVMEGVTAIEMERGDPNPGQEATSVEPGTLILDDEFDIVFASPPDDWHRDRVLRRIKQLLDRQSCSCSCQGKNLRDPNDRNGPGGTGGKTGGQGQGGHGTHGHLPAGQTTNKPVQGTTGQQGRNRRRAPTCLELVYIDAVLCDVATSTIDEAEEVFIRKLTPRAIKDIAESLTQLDEISGKVVQPKQQYIIDWASIVKDSVASSQQEAFREAKLVPLEDLKTLLLDKMQPHVAGAIQSHLTPLYVAETDTEAGQSALRWFGTSEFVNAVMFAAIRDALCSAAVGAGLASEIIRILAVQWLKEKKLKASEAPMTEFEAFQIQLDISRQAEVLQGKMQTFEDECQRLAESGAQNVAASAQKTASELGMKRASENGSMFAITAQTGPAADYSTAVAMSRFGASNKGKAGGKGRKVGGSKTQAQVRAAQVMAAENGTVVYAVSAGPAPAA